MKRKAFTLTLAAFLLASLAACSNGTNSSKTANETTSAVETSVSENAHSRHHPHLPGFFAEQRD